MDLINKSLMNYNSNIMTLTADSGSTKCDWILVDEEKESFLNQERKE